MAGSGGGGMFASSLDDDDDSATFANELNGGRNLASESPANGDLLGDGLHSPSPLLDTAILPSDTGSFCPYCNKPFRKIDCFVRLGVLPGLHVQPRVLDCLHSMCEDCIIAQLDGRRDFTSASLTNATVSQAMIDCVLEQASAERPTPPGVIRCPVCKQESHVGNDMRFVNLMLHDFVRMNELEAETMATGQRPCKACKSEEAAVALCQHCPADLCPNCVNAHKFMRCFDGHTVVTYDELMAAAAQDGSPTSGRRRVTLHQTVMCAVHGVPHVVLCPPCECLICPQCQPEHATHPHDLKIVTEEIKQLVQQQLAEEAEIADRKAKATSAASAFIPDRLTDLSVQHERASSAIDEAFESYHRCLDEARIAMQTELDRVRDEMERQLHTICENVDRNVGKISDAVNFTHRLLAGADAMELLASRKKVYDQLKSLQHSIPSCQVAVELEYRPADAGTFTRQLTAIAGKISCVIQTAAKDESAFMRTTAISTASQLPHPQPLRPSNIAGSVIASGNSNIAGGGVSQAYSTSNSRGSSASANPSPPFTAIRGNEAVMGGGSGVAQQQPQSILGASSSGPGTIGMERRQQRNSQQQPSLYPIGSGLGRMGSIDQPSPQTPNDFHSVSNNGWPPSSNPPPLDEQQLTALAARKMTANSGQQSSSNAYVWPPSSNPLMEQQAAAAALLSAPQTPLGGPPSLIGFPPLAPPGPPGLPPLLKPTPTGLWGAPPANSSSLMSGLPAHLQLAASALLSAGGRNAMIGPGGMMPPMDPVMHPADPMMAAAIAGMVLDGSARQRSSQCPTPSELHLGAIGDRATSRVTRNGEMSEMKTFCIIGGGTAGNQPCQFNTPHGFCLGLQDEIVVADTQNHRIQIVSAKTTYMLVAWGRQGKADGELFYPRKVAMMTRAGHPIYIVCDRGPERSRMQLFKRQGEFIRKYPIDYCDIVAGLCYDSRNEEIVLVDSVSPTIFRLNCETGQMLHYIDCQNSMQEPSDIAVFRDDYYVCDFKGNAICVFARNGQLLRRIGSQETTPFPSGIDISVAGDVLVGDSHGNRYHVAAFTTTGKLQQEFELLAPKVSRCSGLRITPEGHVVTLARNNNQVLVMNTLFLR